MSLNAIIGENGIISNAQNAKIQNGMTVLEEWIQQQYLEYYEELDKYTNKQELLADNINGIFLKDGTKNYITYNGKMYYLINKANLPNQVKEALVGGNASEFAKYVRLQDVYGLTDNLKVYYIDNESGTTYGNVEVADINPNTPLVKSNQNKTAKDIVSKFLKEKYQITVDEELGITSGNITLLKELEIDGNEISPSEKESFKNNFDFIGELNAIQKLTLRNLELSNFNGIESCSLLNYIYLDNCKIGDYTKLSQVLGLKELYFYFPKELNETEANEEIDKLGIGLGKADDLHSLTSFGISGNYYFDDGVYTYNYCNTRNLTYNSSWNKNLGVNLENEKSNFSSINGLSNFSKSIKTSISNLYLNNNNIKSIEALKDFSGINKLQLMGNTNLTNFMGLGNKTNLEYLVAQNSGITKKGAGTDNLGIQDISGLDGCSKLYYLSLMGNSNLESLEGLNKCSNLYFLLCDNCNISNIEALAGTENKGLTKLEFLYLENNSSLSNISSLKKCSNIKNLYLAGITVLDEEVLTSKEFKDIIKNCRSNYSLDDKYGLLFLDGEKLTLGNAKDDQLKLIKGKTELKALSLYGSTDLSSQSLNDILPTLTGLEELILNGVTNLNSVSFATDIPNLVELDLRGTAVTDLSTLETLAKKESFALGTLFLNNEGINLSSFQTLVSRVSLNYVYSDFNLLGESVRSNGIVLENSVLCEALKNCTKLTAFRVYYGTSSEWMASTTSNWKIDFSNNVNKIEKIFLRGFNGKIILPPSCGELSLDSWAPTLDASSCRILNRVYMIWLGQGETINSLLSTLNSNLGLEYFGLGSCLNFSSLNDFSSLKNAGLKTLYLQNCTSLSNLNFNVSMVGLTTLSVVKCPKLSSIDGMSGLQSLTKLELYNTPISSLEAFRNHKALTTININNTKVASLEPLTNVTTLTKIEANNCSLTSLQGVENLRALNYLDVSGNSIANLYYLDLLRENVGSGSFALATLNLASNSLVNSDVIFVDGANASVNNIQIITDLYSKGLHNINISGNDSLDKTDFKEKSGIIV